MSAGGTAREEVTTDASFWGLEIAGNGNVHPVGEHRFSEHVLGADVVLDDFERHLTERGSNG